MFKKLGMVVLGITLLFGIAACTEAPPVEVEAAGTYVSIDINPSIEFIVDENDIVISFNLLNEDAEIICVDTDFVGMNIEDAAALFIELATEGGYIDVTSDDNAVLITVIGDDETEPEKQLTTKLKERIRNRVIHFMAMNYINGEVLTEDFTQTDLIAQADELGVSPGKLKLVLLTQTIDEDLLLEDGIAMPVRDLMKIIREYHQDKISQMSDEEFALREEKKEELFKQFKQRFIDHVSSNPSLTDEQIENRVNAINNAQRTETRNKWQERINKWQERMEEKRNGSSDENDSGSSS